MTNGLDSVMKTTIITARAEYKRNPRILYTFQKDEKKKKFPRFAPSARHASSTIRSHGIAVVRGRSPGTVVVCG